MKKILLIIFVFLFCITSVYAWKKSFKFDVSKINFLESSKDKLISSKLNDYSVGEGNNKNEEVTNEITNFIMKATFLLLGEENNQNESSENYIRRKKEFQSLRYAPEVPKNENGEPDENSQEYKDEATSSFIMIIFRLFNELNIRYKEMGNVKISELSDGSYAVSILLPNVKIYEENEDNPFEYLELETNLIVYYQVKKLNNEFKIIYFEGETVDSLDNYFKGVEKKENTGETTDYDSKLEDIYDFSQLKALDKNTIKKIYNNNENKVVILSGINGQAITHTAMGFVIKDGLIVTTWDFLRKSLIDSEEITIKDKDGNNYKIDGIVSIDIDSNLVVIKMNDQKLKAIKLGDSTKMKKENPVIAISSKSGFGLSVTTGIIISNKNGIQSALPLTDTDEGSPLFNKNGEVIGMNTADSINSSISFAISSVNLLKLKEKLDKESFESIETTTFKKLKEDNYYIKINEETIKISIPDKVWNKYKKIGNIDKAINMTLIKASYQDNIVSLRYHNKISDIISPMARSEEFRNNLIKEGYKEVLSGSKKYIYESSDYKIIIMEEFDYLIVVIVKR